MQRALLSAFVAAVCAVSGVSALKAVQLATQQDSPVAQVVQLLNELKANIEADGTAEQATYDKYACWCEDTLAEKAADISAARQQIDALQASILKLKADLATHAAEIKQVKKDIAANLESQREAEEVRQKENEGYEAEKVESEQCIGALEAAIKVLTGAGAKKNFLETLQEAQLLSVAAGIKGLLMQPVVSRTVSQQDMQVVRHFVDKPEDFLGNRAGIMSAAQIANNPFGDYAPQSTQIQGILKSMYDSFTVDLEKSNADEAQKQKAFEELMETKRNELTTLQSTLSAHESDQATKGKSLSDDKISLQDTQEQLEADEKFFAETKDTCKARASDWAQRTRLRTEELHGIAQAVAVLSSEDAQATFQNAASLLQLRSRNDQRHAGERDAAYKQLKIVASKYHSLRLAKIAVVLKSEGHFDKLMHIIDNMVATLRREEQQDIEEKTMCEAKGYKNKIDLEDIQHDIEKTGATIERLGGEVTTMQTEIGELEGDINATETSLDELKDLRIQAHAEFVQGVKDDTDAVALLGRAIQHLARFHKNNDKPLSLVRKDDPAAPPELGWTPGKYESRRGEKEGIVAILEMIKEDLQNEITVARTEDAAAQVAYEKDSAALRDTLAAQKRSKLQQEKELAALNAKIVDLESFAEMRGNDQDAENSKKEAIETLCAWVASHFDSRREKRKAEIAGLQDAKSYLAGVEDGTALE